MAVETECVGVPGERAVFGMMGVNLDVPDHTTLSRRGQRLDIRLRRAPTSKAIHLIVDSTGLSIVGEGEWAAAKHGGKGRRGWKKLQLGVDRSGVIVAQALTDGNADSAYLLRTRHRDSSPGTSGLARRDARPRSCR